MFRYDLAMEALRRIERTQQYARGLVWVEDLEAYVDLVPRAWTKGVALWLEPGTVAHFRSLTVEPSTK